MDDENLIERLPTGPLTERELQETRHSNHNIINRMVSPSEIKEWGRKIDALWLCFGWLPMTVKSWKAISAAVVIAVLLGGQSFIDTVTIFLKANLP